MIKRPFTALETQSHGLVGSSGGRCCAPRRRCHRLRWRLRLHLLRLRQLQMPPG